jgi:hypothetical protein
MKTTTSITIDVDVARTAKASGKNISALVDSYLRSYFNINKEELSKDKLIADRAELEAKINELESEVAKNNKGWK